MREVGRVRAIDGDTATIAFTRRKECGHCGACSLGGMQSDEVEMRAANEARAAVGQEVVVEMRAGVLGAAAVLYTIPLAGLFLFYYVGTWVASTAFGAEVAQHGGVLGAALGVLLGFALVSAYDRRLRGDARRKPRVVEIVN